MGKALGKQKIKSGTTELQSEGLVWSLGTAIGQHVVRGVSFVLRPTNLPVATMLLKEKKKQEPWQVHQWSD